MTMPASRPPSTHPFACNGRRYAPPARPVAVVCLDGSADEYLNAALVRDLMPNLQRFAVQGFRGLARAAMPTFTNVNNTSIVTGVPPAVHGICGNYFLDPDTGTEVMMNSASFLRCPTLLAAARNAGRKVALVTAKEKLRDLLSRDLVQAGGIAFSSERASQASGNTHGIDRVESLVGRTPPIYSADASLYVLRAGVALLERGLADLLYLTTTDFIQHAHAPTDAEALEFYARLDLEFGRLAACGAVIGVTADHGMNAKQKPDGSPEVIYLESALVEAFGDGFRVTLPITDPYVAHHGALGSFVVVHVPPGVKMAAIIRWLEGLPGITEVHDRATAACRLELPADRLGDVVVIAGRNTVIGRTPAHHDLTVLHGGLRSHGGRYEEMVPLILSHPLKAEHAARASGDVRNFDVFDLTLNGTHLLPSDP